MSSHVHEWRMTAAAFLCSADTWLIFLVLLFHQYLQFYCWPCMVFGAFRLHLRVTLFFPSIDLVPALIYPFGLM